MPRPRRDFWIVSLVQRPWKPTSDQVEPLYAIASDECSGLPFYAVSWPLDVMTILEELLCLEVLMT